MSLELIDCFERYSLVFSPIFVKQTEIALGVYILFPFKFNTNFWGFLSKVWPRWRSIFQNSLELKGHALGMCKFFTVKKITSLLMLKRYQYSLNELIIYVPMYYFIREYTLSLCDRSISTSFLLFLLFLKKLTSMCEWIVYMYN